MEQQKYAKYRITIGVLAVLVVIAFFSTGYTFVKSREQQQQQPFTGSNYLFLEEFKIGPGQVTATTCSARSSWINMHGRSIWDDKVPHFEQPLTNASPLPQKEKYPYMLICYHNSK